MDISIVIPLLNEDESLNELYDWIVRVVQSNSFSYEIIFIDDGSTDASWQVIETLSDKDKNVKGIRFLRNYGKSQALHAGFKIAQGEVVITMDADLQDSPDEIPELYQMIKEQGNDLVSGWKKKRYDSKIRKNIPSKLFNWAARRTSGVYLHDFNCGLKAYDLNVVKNVNVHGEMHRYIPVLAKNAGYNKITEKVVTHQARKYGVTKFGMSRFINGFLDLITIWFVSKFGKRPMHFFGLLGTLMFIIGFFSAFYIGLMKLLRLYYYHAPTRLVTDNPWFYIAMTTMLIGTFFFLAGFLGEMIVRSNPDIERYKIAEQTNIK
jgi:glycosyltransferase involved in cell wall biosynthesis